MPTRLNFAFAAGVMSGYWNIRMHLIKSNAHDFISNEKLPTQNFFEMTSFQLVIVMSSLAEICMHAVSCFRKDIITIPWCSSNMMHFIYRTILHFSFYILNLYTNTGTCRLSKYQIIPYIWYDKTSQSYVFSAHLFVCSCNETSTNMLVDTLLILTTSLLFVKLNSKKLYILLSFNFTFICKDGFIIQ